MYIIAKFCARTKAGKWPNLGIFTHYRVFKYAIWLDFGSSRNFSIFENTACANLDKITEFTVALNNDININSHILAGF